MKQLIFGLPGAGKTTLVKASKMHEMHLDLGHNSFKSNEAREKFYSKLVRFTSSLVSLKASFIMDTYPEYFDIDAVAKNDCFVVFLLPQNLDEARELVQRVGNRDGFNSEFYKLYAKQYVNWYKDWMKTYNLWRSKLGSGRVLKLGIHVSEKERSNNGRRIGDVTY